MPRICDCPSCGRRLLVPEDVAQSQVSCPTCRAVFVPDGPLPGREEGLTAARPAAAAPRELVREDLPPADSYQEPEPAATPDAAITVYPAAPEHADYQPLRESGPLPGGPAAAVAMTLLATNAGFSLVSSVPLVMRYHLLEGALHGVRFPREEDQALVVAINLLGVLQLMLRIGTAVAFCTWFYQAHENLRRLGARGLSYTSGWAAGAFFVPILNLFRPYQIAQEVWKASDPAAPPGDRYGWRRRPGSVLIGGWWACWLLGNIVAAFSRLGRVGAPRDLRGLQWAVLVAILSHALAAVAAVLALFMVRDIRQRQLRKDEARVTS
jgi:hypothetical protein